jgi:hypothetical protein
MKLLLPFLFFIFLFLGMSHPFYVSMTDIAYNTKEKQVEVSVRIFTDDFEKTLRKDNPNMSIDLLKPKDRKLMEKIITAYINQHLKLSVNDKTAAVQFIGYEQQEESIWSYFQVNDISSLQSLQVNNTLLYDYKKEQLNMVHVKASSKDETQKLTYPASALIFRF